MKKLLLLLFVLPYGAFGQYNVAYTVTVTKLKALADDCDGGAPFCLNAPQDPVYNIWTNDGEANENTNCWIFEDDPDAEYGYWKDIQNLEIANESGVNTSYISFDMSGFESDAIGSPGCTSSLGDDAVYSRQFVQQFDLATVPQGVTTEYEIDLDDVYFAKVEIFWVDLNAGIFELDDALSFYMSPNPTEGNFKLNFDGYDVNDFGVRVIDVAGRTVFQKDYSGNEATIQLTSELSGVYFVEVNVDGKIGTKKLMVK